MNGLVSALGVRHDFGRRGKKPRKGSVHWWKGGPLWVSPTRRPCEGRRVTVRSLGQNLGGNGQISYNEALRIGHVNQFFFLSMLLPFSLFYR